MIDYTYDPACQHFYIVADVLACVGIAYLLYRMAEWKL